MSELRVNTIAANSTSSISIDDDTVVSGTLTATSTLTGQGNIVATGQVTAGSGFVGGPILADGNNINDVANLNCANVSATGNGGFDSLSVASGASVGSLTIGGTAYDQRVKHHVVIELQNETTVQLGTSGNAYRFGGNNFGTLTLRNNHGITSATQTSSGFQGAIRIVLNVARSAPRHTLICEYFTSGLRNIPVHPYVVWTSDTQIDLLGGYTIAANGANAWGCKYIQFALIG